MSQSINFVKFMVIQEGGEYHVSVPEAESNSVSDVALKTIAHIRAKDNRYLLGKMFYTQNTAMNEDIKKTQSIAVALVGSGRLVFKKQLDVYKFLSLDLCHENYRELTIIEGGNQVLLKDSLALRTIFLQVVRNGNTSIVRKALDLGLDPNTCSMIAGGIPALSIAVKNNHAEVVYLLISYHASVDYSSPQKFNLLMYAARKANPQIMRMLLESGAKVNQQNKQGDTALALAVKENNPECIRWLLAAGANPNIYIDVERSPLYIATQKALECNDYKMVELLCKHGALVPQRAIKLISNYSSGSSILFGNQSTRTKFSEFLEYNQKHNAYNLSKFSKVEQFKDYCTEHDLSEDFIRNRFVCCMKDFDTRTGYSFVMTMLAKAKKGRYNGKCDPELIEFLLDKLNTVEDIFYATDVDPHSCKDKLISMLFECLDEPHLTRVMKGLISKGLSINYQEKEGETLLSSACQKGSMELIRYLLLNMSSEAIDSYDSNCKDKLISMLFECLDEPHLTRVMKGLISKGLSINYQDKEGKTLLASACQKGSMELIRYLLLNMSSEAIDSYDSKGENASDYLLERLDSGCASDKDIIRKSIFPLMSLGITPSLRLREKYEANLIQLFSDEARASRFNKFLESQWKTIDTVFAALDEDTLRANRKYGQWRNKEGETALMYACKNGNIAQVRSILSLMDLEAKDAQGRTAIFYALGEGNLDIVQLLMENGADCYVLDRDGINLVSQAVSHGNLPVIQKLVSCGIDLHRLNQKCKDSKQAPLLSKCIPGATDCLQYLIDQGVPLNDGCFFLTESRNRRFNDEFRLSPLSNAIMCDDHEMVNFLLHQPGLSLTTLHLAEAVLYKRRKIIEILIQSGLNFRRDEDFEIIIVPTYSIFGARHLSRLYEQGASATVIWSYVNKHWSDPEQCKDLSDLELPGSIRLLVESRCQENDSLMELNFDELKAHLESSDCVYPNLLVSNLRHSISGNSFLLQAVEEQNMDKLDYLLQRIQANEQGLEQIQAALVAAIDLGETDYIDKISQHVQEHYPQHYSRLLESLFSEWSSLHPEEKFLRGSSISHRTESLNLMLNLMEEAEIEESVYNEIALYLWKCNLSLVLLRTCISHMEDKSFIIDKITRHFSDWYRGTRRGSSRKTLEIDRKRSVLEQSLDRTKGFIFENAKEYPYIKFKGEVGIDAGGLLKEYYYLISKEFAEHFLSKGVLKQDRETGALDFSNNSISDDCSMQCAVVLYRLIGNRIPLHGNFSDEFFQKLISWSPADFGGDFSTFRTNNLGLPLDDKWNLLKRFNLTQANFMERQAHGLGFNLNDEDQLLAFMSTGYKSPVSIEGISQVIHKKEQDLEKFETELASASTNKEKMILDNKIKGAKASLFRHQNMLSESQQGMSKQQTITREEFADQRMQRILDLCAPESSFKVAKYLHICSTKIHAVKYSYLRLLELDIGTGQLMKGILLPSITSVRENLLKGGELNRQQVNCSGIAPKIIGFFERFIRESSDDELKSFLLSCTGSDYLPLSSTIILKDSIYSQPSFYTCFNTVDIHAASNYEQWVSIFKAACDVSRSGYTNG